MLESQPLAFVCGWCKGFSVAKVKGSHLVEPGQDEPEELREPGYWHHLVVCERCNRPSLLGEHEDSRESGPPDILWPERRQALNPAIPADLRSELEEARKCFDSKAFTATAVMVRRSLEGFCLHQGSARKALYDQLQDLAGQGLIDNRLLSWANGLRILGNQGAHFTGMPVSAADAQDALDLAEAVFDYVYVFTAKFEDFQKRRGVPVQRQQS